MNVAFYYSLSIGNDNCCIFPNMEIGTNEKVIVFSITTYMYKHVTSCCEKKNKCFNNSYELKKANAFTYKIRV